MIVKYLLQLYRFDVFIVTTITALLGYTFLDVEPGLKEIGICLFISAFIYNYVYIINALADIKEDMINKADRPLPSGRLSKKTVYIYLAVITIVSVTGIQIFFTGLSLYMAWFVILMGILYSVPPVALKRIPIYGAFVTGWGLIHPIFITGDMRILWDAVILILLAFGNTILKDLSDIEGDRAAGRRVVTDFMSVKGVLLIAIGLLVTSSVLGIFYLRNSLLSILPAITAVNLLVHLFKVDEDTICKKIYDRAIMSTVLSAVIVVGLSYFV